MFDDKVIGFIGAGNMGGAMINGLVSGGTLHGEQIIAADVDEARLNHLHEQYAIRTSKDNDTVAKEADILVISVKPQVMGEVLRSDSATQCDFLLSIMAGVRIETLHQTFNAPRIVRVMPNTPAMIGEGMSVWTATSEISEDQKAQAAAILESLGQQSYVAKEELLDAATALSGSGPAYVFLFMEAMIDAGVHLGFSRAQAEQLVLQTVRGAVLYAESSGTDVGLLRNQVTSPGGTTAEALYHMEKAGLRHAVARGVWGAFMRSVSLGGSQPRNPDSG